jgi:NAD(P)-dependent dehydrogenase (short-subunit alcohol dehydrogenase family)
VIDEHGRLDILINNAGITIDKTVAAMTDDDWHTCSP